MITELDVRDKIMDTRPQPNEDLKKVQIGDSPSQFAKIGAHLSEEEATKMAKFLSQN